jgi:hypothetical protein
MFSKIKALFAKAEAVIEHDVEAIISTFTDTVTKLERAAELQLKKAAHATQFAADATKAADVANTAATKATAVAEKIKALVA